MYQRGAVHLISSSDTFAESDESTVELLRSKLRPALPVDVLPLLLLIPILRVSVPLPPLISL